MADDEEVKESSPWPFLVLLGLVFIAGAITAFALWALFRYKRNKPSVVAVAAGVLAGVALLLIAVSLPSALEALGDLGSIGDHVPALATLWISLSVLLGAPFGFFFVAAEARRLRKNPYLTQLEGSWRYKFEYRRSAVELVRRKNNIKKLNNALLVEPDKSPMGLDEKTDDVVFRYDSEARKHTFLTGATGSGKTITMQTLISADIEVGKTVVVIDFKRSPKFAAKLAAWSEENGREFYHFMNGDVSEYDIPRSKGQCFYDPLKSGTPTSKADMVLGMREYDSNAAVYKSAMQQLLQVLFGMLKVADKKEARGIDWNHGGMFQLASVMSGNGLGELAKACSMEVAPGSTKWTYTKPGAGGVSGAQEVTVNTPMAKNAIELAEAMRSKGPLTQARDELQGQMRTIIASEYGQWMRTGNTAEDREIDLFKLTKEEGNVILFSLNSDSEPEFAQYVGSMIFADLTNISALRRNAGSDNQVNIYVDEFQAVPPTAVTSLLEKSRESKMALTIAQQSFDQVVASAKSSGEAYLNSILDTCANFISHAGATEDSATRLAKLLGKKFVTVYSKSNDNDSSFLAWNRNKNMDSKVAAREEERWVYPPAEFMKLSSPDPANDFKASAVWVTKTSSDPKYAKKGGATARTVWMVPPERVLVEYYEGKQPETRVRRSAPVATADAERDYAQPIAEFDFDEDEPSENQALTSLVPATFESYTSDEVEDDEDDWGMVEIEDEAEEEPAPTVVTPPVRSVTPPRRPTRAEMAANDSVEDLFRSSAPASPDLSKTLAPPRAREPKRTEAAPNRPGLPLVRPGLPSRPGQQPRSSPKPQESTEALPDLKDMQLPEL
jgi:type IV secretory pathway TraG/TraD family ATPase VirD4